MLLTIALPPALMREGDVRVVATHVAAGDAIAPGGRVIDFSVDRSAGAAHDCPPIAHYRLVVRERGRVHTPPPPPGAAIAADGVIALLATEPDEPADGVAARAARVTVAGILFHAGWGARA